MKLSARNQLAGTVVKVQEGAVNGIVALDCGEIVVTGTISMSAIEDLGLAVAIVKATEVMIGLGEMKISARNCFKGTVVSVAEGAVNDIVTMEIAGGQRITATISASAVKDLGLAAGTEAVAVIKATSVMFGVEE
mgnify:CR=1 FL=1